MTLLPNDIRADEARIFTLSDGRALAYAEWGEVDGYPAFYFHGTPSSRLEAAFAHCAAQRNGFRLIALDRPGFGCSTFKQGGTFRDWPADIVALADALQLAEFGVVGHSGAGPHLFACGVHIPPERLKFVGALAPWGPLATPDIVAALNAADRRYARWAQRGPRLFGAVFAPLGWCAKYSPDLFSRLVRASVSGADQQRMSDELFAKHFRAIQLEAFRQGSRGAAYESFLDYRPWEFDLADVAVPTHLWLGTDDTFVPCAMGEYFEQAIPGVDFHWTEGKGHFNIEDWDAILAACAADIGK
ncbi:alpha/beta fold hydrolase [Mycobacterium szulgai]|uniref:Alpha/beta hydrolase n=1 Tax=Mycobacterium szulgai TaxID=1787 RepID=A0A1X2EBR0_MYCSZ|nr:alpha/beta hydrolase [Mycobacterium szulgai]MCV7077793.1 alpha/beta hydrolase [Mycobacterium szulgai]ORW97856.1 alpha/beta hydrolase [Mycobacterium szulgai]